MYQRIEVECHLLFRPFLQPLEIYSEGEIYFSTGKNSMTCLNWNRKKVTDLNLNTGMYPPAQPPGNLGAHKGFLFYYLFFYLNGFDKLTF